jgi:hypothetical protein
MMKRQAMANITQKLLPQDTRLAVMKLHTKKQRMKLLHLQKVMPAILLHMPQKLHTNHYLCLIISPRQISE